MRTAAVWDDPENDELYRAQVRGLLADLHGFSNRMTKFGRLFGDQTTARIDLSRPVDFDISALAQSGDDVVAAVLATTWTSAFAAKNAADVLAEEGIAAPAQPRDHHGRDAPRFARQPLMVEKLDLLTRLNRQWGVGQIMITHTFKDLMCMETPAQNTKARGFVERSEIKVLGALSRIEVDRYLRGECGLPVSRREEDMLEDWATPVNFGSDASHKGSGPFPDQIGRTARNPHQRGDVPARKSGFNDTNLKMARLEGNPAMTDHLATGMKRMIRTVARSASLSDRLGEQSRLLRLTGNRSTLDFRPAEHGASSWDLEMSITPAEPYGNTETREPVWRETVDSATYGESRARVAHAVETFRIYDSTGFLPETENR